MFKGVIKQNTKHILMNYIKELNIPKIAVGCAGAFTIENALVTNFKPTHILSSDVTIFTSAIGFYLSDRDYNVEIVSEEYAFVRPFITDLVHKTAVLLYLQDVAEFYRSENFYNIRMRLICKEEIAEMVEIKVKRLEEIKDVYKRSGVSLTYIPQDVVEFVKDIPEDYLFVAFPPFYKGDYEKMYRFVDQTVYAPELTCEYKVFDDSSLVGMVQTLIDRKIPFIIGTNKSELFKDNPEIKIVGFDYFSMNEIVHFITNLELDKSFAEIPTKRLEEFNVELTSEEDILAMNEQTKIEIKEIPLDLLDAVRRTRISNKVKKLSAPLTKFGCFADGKLFGVFGIDVIQMKYQSDCFYLLSDIPVTNVHKISKLVPALATTREIRTYLRSIYLIDHAKILTTAFTEKPSSMKYRNFWSIDVVGKKDGVQYINYVANMGQFNIKEIYQKWLRLNTKTTPKKS